MKKENKAGENLPFSEKKRETDGKKPGTDTGTPDSSAKQNAKKDTLFEPKTVMAPGGDLDAIDIDIRPADNDDFRNSLPEDGFPGKNGIDGEDFKILADDNSPHEKKEPEFEESPVIAINGELDSLQDDPDTDGYDKNDDTDDLEYNDDESTIFDIDTLTLLEMEEAAIEKDAPVEIDPDKKKDSTNGQAPAPAPETHHDDDFSEDWDPMADADDSTLDLMPDMIVDPPGFLDDKKSKQEEKTEPVLENILEEDTKDILEPDKDARTNAFTDSTLIDIDNNELFADEKTIDFAKLEARKKEKKSAEPPLFSDTGIIDIENNELFADEKTIDFAKLEAPKKEKKEDIVNLDGTTLEMPKDSTPPIDLADDDVVELSAGNILEPEPGKDDDKEPVSGPDFKAMALSSKTDSDLKKDGFSDRDAQTIIDADISFPSPEPTEIPLSSDNLEIFNPETFSEPVEEGNVASSEGEKTVFAPISSIDDEVKLPDKDSEKTNLKTISILDTLEDSDLSGDDNITDTIGLIDVLGADVKTDSSKKDTLSTILEIEKIPDEDFPIGYDEKEKPSREPESAGQASREEKIKEPEIAFSDEASVLEPEKKIKEQKSVKKETKTGDKPLKQEKVRKIQIFEKENVTGVFMVYPDKIEEMMERVFEKVFEKKIEKILRRIIEKSVKEEINKLSNMFNIDDVDELPPDNKIS